MDGVINIIVEMNIFQYAYAMQYWIQYSLQGLCDK